jgi:hypothetical protein
MFRITLAAVTVAAISVPTFGTITVDIGVSTSGGSVANALNVTTTNDWIGTDLLVTLTQGSVINLDPGLGGVDAAPSPGQIVVYPALLFDTYLGRVGQSLSGIYNGAVELGAPDVADLGPGGISAEWQGDLASGPLTIGNIVLSDDAVGTWSLAMFESYNAQANFISGTLSNGVLQTDFLASDLNDDSFTGIDDLNIVLGQWNTDGSTDPRSDPTGDAFVGIEDLNLVLRDWNASMVQGPWSYSPVGVAGDLDDDGFVGIQDLNILFSYWHNTVTPGDMADPSGDGFVGLDDMNIVQTYWNNGSPPMAVPEPLGITVLSLGTLALLRRRQA